MTRRTADFALIRGRIWTPGLPEAEALAAVNGRIVAIGRERDIADLIAPGTRVLDAGGRRVLPGLADAHLHFVPGGLSLRRLDLSGCADRGTFVAAVAAYAAQRDRDAGLRPVNPVPSGMDPRPGTSARAPESPRAWLQGGGWSNDHWADRALPRREWIDALTGDRPAFIYRLDCHAALVNSAALAIAGIDRHGPDDPPGGRIDRDPDTREPTGILRDAAMKRVLDCIPPPTPAEREQAVRDAVAHSHRNGVTMVHNMLDAADVEAVLAVRRDGGPFVRMYAIVHQPPDAAGIELWRRLQPGDDWLRCGACKTYMDGSLGSRTAWMLEPYAEDADPASPCGLRLDNQRTLEQFIAADRAGVQLCTHAIGDAANRRLLELYEQVARAGNCALARVGGPAAADPNGATDASVTCGCDAGAAGPCDRRPRVEHAQHLAAADVPCFARLGAVASMQPLHKFDDGGYAERALGRARAAGAYRFRELLDAGAVLAFGSDWPIVSINPFEGIRAAVTGRTRSGQVWLPEQNLTLDQALRAYTVGPAHACFMEDRIGKLLPGYWADLIVLDRDIFAIAPDEIADVRPAATVQAGDVVWRAS